MHSVVVTSFRYSKRPAANSTRLRQCWQRVTLPREVVATALAHVIGDRAEQAYRRSDALEQRRQLMEAWAAHCEPGSRGNVVGLGNKAPRT